MSNSKNPNEEQFQFRPITQGLGFHPKVVTAVDQQGVDLNDEYLNEAISTSLVDNSGHSSIQSQAKSLLSEKQFRAKGLDLIEGDKATEFKSPLPRKSSEALTPHSQVVDDLLNKMNKQKGQLSTGTEIQRGARPHGGAEIQKGTSPQIKSLTQTSTQNQINRSTALKADLYSSIELKQTPVSLAACFLDGMLIAAGTLVSMIILLTVAQIDLVAAMAKGEDVSVYFSAFLVLSGVALVYQLVTRAFLGSTAGEWAYDQQLGTDKDHRDIYYVPLVILRTLIGLATGGVILPLLSVFFGKDLIGKWIGLELYRKSDAV